MADRTRILFVCLGNICRSPAAEEVMRVQIKKAGLERAVEVDSAGLISYHAGELPDSRMRSHAARRGYILSSRSRPVEYDDFFRFDYIIGMDQHNIVQLQKMAPTAESMAHIHLFTDFTNRLLHDHIPDPYYGGADGFELVLDLVEDCAQGLIAHLQRKHTDL